MKCLTICQPWAWAILHAGKTVENRTWKTNYRGPLLIHAGKSRKWLDELQAQGELSGPVLPNGTPVPDGLVFGAILGVVNVVGCVPFEEVADDPFASGPWCWQLANPQAFDEPVRYSGKQMLFDVPDEIYAKALPVPCTSCGVNLLLEPVAVKDGDEHLCLTCAGE